MFLLNLNVKMCSVFLLCLMLVLISACGSNHSSQKTAFGGGEHYYNEGKQVRLFAGESGKTARSIVKILETEQMINFPLSVVNAPGTEALDELVKNKGDAYTVAVTSSATLSNYHRGDTEYEYKDVTMIARLMTDYSVVVVPASSPYKLLPDLLEDAKKDPSSITIGVASEEDKVPYALLMEEEGADVAKVNFIASEGKEELVNNMLNGETKAVVSSISGLASSIDGGAIRALGVLSKKRLRGELKDIPTAIEQGIKVTHGNWYGLMGPPDIKEAPIRYWEEKIEKITWTRTWGSIARKNHWEKDFIKGEEFKQFLDNENKKKKKIFQSIFSRAK
jgi:putative tricarboxylic transport membrane protein